MTVRPATRISASTSVGLWYPVLGPMSGRKPLAIVWKPSGTDTLDASSIIRSRPRNSSMPASVTMNAGIPTYATQ